MIEFLLATALECEGSRELIQKVMKSREPLIDKHELIEVIRLNTEPGCYERPESST